MNTRSGSHRTSLATILFAAGGLATGAAACSLGALDAYDSGATSTSGSSSSSGSSSGVSTGGSTGSSSGGLDGGPGGAPPDASCATAAGSCVENAPVGWTGPFAFYEGATASAPACPSDFPAVAVDAHEGTPTAPPAQCSACTCGAAQGLDCTGKVATMQLYTDTNCQTPCTSLRISAAGCGPTVNGGCSNAVAFTMAAPTASGTCPPGGGAATITPVSWPTAARGCMPSVAMRDCPAGSTCAPVPAAPFGQKMCIAQAGDVACPTGSYTEKHSAFASAHDERGCGACTCGNATAHCGDFALNPGGDCFGPFFMQDTPLPIACNPVPTGGMYSYDYGDSINPKSPPCAPSGGQPVGSVTPQGPLTICCAM